MGTSTLRTSDIEYHNRSSTDFGMRVLFPSFNPPAPAPGKQLLTVPGFSGDYSDGNHTYNAVDTQVSVVIYLPERYRKMHWFEGWAKLKSDITAWLYGDPGWLKFGYDPDYLYKAEVLQAPEFTPVNSERVNSTIIFHFQPYKYNAKTIHYQKLPSSGVIYNDGNVNVRPDWHIKGTGNFTLMVNDWPYEFDNLDGDLYLIGDEGNAYSADPSVIQENSLLNSHLMLPNNMAPQLLCAGNGANTISISAMDTDSKLDLVEFKPLFRRFI